MRAFRFRILTEAQDDFLRDIDVPANQTFEDLHHFIVSLFGLRTDELASFYICDHKWRRLKELTLIDMQHDEADENVDDYDEDEREANKKRPVFVMGDVKMKDMIDDPHQRLIYEYDFLKPIVFYIELIKIVSAVSDTTYPSLVRSVGEFVKRIPQIPFNDDDLGEDLLTTEDDLLDDTFYLDAEDATITESPEW